MCIKYSNGILYIMDLKHEVIMRSIKVIDIGFVTVLYFILAFFLSIMADRIMGNFNEKQQEEKSTLRISIEVCIHMWIVGVLIYAARNIIEEIPSPFDGIYGFKHSLVK